MNKDQIDELIWGDFESKILEMRIPLWMVNDVIKSWAMDGALALFVGFLHFVQFKRGLKPNFELHDGRSIFKDDNVIPDFEDPSWWVNNLEHVDMIEWSFMDDVKHFPQYFFKQYIGKNDNEDTICLLMNTFSFFECGKILNETKLDNESKYSFSEISKEFHIRSDGMADVLLYIKNLENIDWAYGHTLVFRPSKLIEYLSALDESLSSLGDFPEQIARKEEWDKMDMVEKVGICGRSEPVSCKEDNIRELLRKYSIKIPNVKLVTFYEYLKDKLDPSISKEWEDIRNRYISKLKNSILESHLSNDYSRAKKHLQNSEKCIESKDYSSAIIFANKAIENAVSTFSKNPKLSMRRKIDALESNQELGGHIPNLHHVCNIRNVVVHDSPYELSEDDAKDCFGMVNRFLADIQKTL